MNRRQLLQLPFRFIAMTIAARFALPDDVDTRIVQFVNLCAEQTQTANQWNAITEKGNGVSARFNELISCGMTREQAYMMAVMERCGLD